MFESNGEEKKLDWMYKGPSSTVAREEYLLGRSVDKSLEQINEAEKQNSDIKSTKNHVEHECIPPSIRDFKNLTSNEQVDLQQKLQEDPLIAIKKQEEETRKRLLQNPIQLKKLQDAISIKSDKHKNKKVKKEKELGEKHKGSKKHKKLSKKMNADKNLDELLFHKIKILRQKLGDDLNRILNMDSSSSDSDEHNKSNQKYKKKTKSKHFNNDQNKTKNTEQFKESINMPNSKIKIHSLPSSDSDSNKKYVKNYDSQSDDEEKYKKRRYGLIKPDLHSDRTQQPARKQYKSEKIKMHDKQEPKIRGKVLSEKEKEELLENMKKNAKWRDSERENNIKRYREENKKEIDRHIENYGSNFIHDQLRKSANTSSVESRIKSNIHNIQRSKDVMEKHFSRRY